MPDRRVAPPLQHTLHFQLPQPEHFLEKEGLNGWLVASDLQPVVRIEVYFHAGKITEKQEAISNFTAMMLEKGTRHHTAEQIAAHLDYHSAHLEISPGMDLSSVGLYSLTRNLKHVLPLYLELIQEPSFDEDELRLTKEIFTQNLRVNQEKNAYLAGQLIRGLVFGDHPYGTTVMEKDIEAISGPLLNEFFKAHYQPFAVFVAGSITQEDLRTLTEGLPTGTLLSATPSAPSILKGEQRIEKKDAVQCSIRMGKSGLVRTDPDFPVFLLTNHILGGYFGSRLMKNIREEKGLTYGIYSGIQHMQQAVFQTIGADVNKENLDTALSAIREELQNLGNLSVEELDTARKHFIGSMQNDVNTIFAAADKLKTINLNQLPSDFYQNVIHRIDALTTTDIKKAAEKYFQPQDFSVAVAG
jgi:predicted Zn-dependent peptidase